MRRLLLLALAFAASALPAAGSPAGSAGGDGAPVYAVTGSMGDAQISRRNPRTLGQLGRAVPLGQWEFVNGLSPDGSLLATMAMNARPVSIRFLDLTRGEWSGGGIELPQLGIRAVRWLDPRTIVVLGMRPNGLRAVFVDSARGRVVRKVRVPSNLEGPYAEPTAAGMALLLRPLMYRPMGPVLLGIIRPSGVVKIVEVERVSSGHVERSRRPALIADPSSSHAYVLGGLDEPVADVDLRTLTVRYHTLQGPRPLEGTLGAERFGTWLAPGRIVIGGWDDSDTATRRLGLSVVDTKTWRLKRIDLDADFFVKSDDLLLSLHLDGSLSAFGLGGQRRFSVAEQVFQLGTVASNGRYVYAYNLAPGSPDSALVVDGRLGGGLSWVQAPPFSLVFSPGLWVLGL